MKVKCIFNKLNTTSPNHWGIKSNSHLDIGCGPYARNPFDAINLYGADISAVCPENLPQNRFYTVSPDGLLPFENDSFDSISGFDFIEHLSRENGNPNAFIQFMNEASRVLVPGGVLLCVTPSYPAPAAFQDPTHINVITENSVRYFLNRNDENRGLDYGVTSNFRLVAQFWVGPLSQIRKPFWESKGFRLMSLATTIRSISAIRSFISASRKPTHLV